MDSTDSSPLRRLLDEREIREILYRRARTTDDGDLEGSLSCYHSDATENHEGYAGPVRDYIAEHSPAFDPNGGVLVCHHLLGNIEYAFDEGGADVVTYFVCHLTVVEDGAEVHYVNAGRYLDRFTQRDGAWRIAARECVYDWSRRDAATPPWWTSPRSGTGQADGDRVA